MPDELKNLPLMIYDLARSGKYKRINSFAIPLFLNNITALIIGLCDAAIVGRVSTEAFASVTLIANTINSIVGVLGSVSLALNIIGAKLKGKNDEKQLKENILLLYMAL